MEYAQAAIEILETCLFTNAHHLTGKSAKKPIIQSHVKYSLTDTFAQSFPMPKVSIETPD